MVKMMYMSIVDTNLHIFSFRVVMNSKSDDIVKKKEMEEKRVYSKS